MYSLTKVRVLMPSVKGRVHREGGSSKLTPAERSGRDLSGNSPLTEKVWAQTFFSLVAAFLEYNSLNITLILLKQKQFSGKLVYLWSCARFFTNFRTFPSFQKETLYPLVVDPHPPFPAVPGSHQSTGCYFTLTYTGHFL